MGKATELQSSCTSALCWRWINKVLVVSACWGKATGGRASERVRANAVEEETLRAVCLILCILNVERMRWLRKQCMDGGTVNCSSNTPDAVREGTDELGGCSNIPRENSGHAVYVCAYVCVCLCVWEHVQAWKKDISDQFTEEACHFDGQTWLQLVFSALALHPIPEWGGTLRMQM